MQHLDFAYASSLVRSFLEDESLVLTIRGRQIHTKKKVNILFFEKRKEIYSLWEFGFADENDHNSIELLKSVKFEIQNK